LLGRDNAIRQRVFFFFFFFFFFLRFLLLSLHLLSQQSSWPSLVQGEPHGAKRRIASIRILQYPSAKNQRKDDWRSPKKNGWPIFINSLPCPLLPCCPQRWLRPTHSQKFPGGFWRLPAGPGCLRPRRIATYWAGKQRASGVPGSAAPPSRRPLSRFRSVGILVAGAITEPSGARPAHQRANNVVPPWAGGGAGWRNNPRRRAGRGSFFSHATAGFGAVMVRGSLTWPGAGPATQEGERCVRPLFDPQSRPLRRRSDSRPPGRVILRAEAWTGTARPVGHLRPGRSEVSKPGYRGPSTTAVPSSRKSVPRGPPCPDY